MLLFFIAFSAASFAKLPTSPQVRRGLSLLQHHAQIIHSLGRALKMMRQQKGTVVRVARTSSVFLKQEADEETNRRGMCGVRRGSAVKS